MYLKQNSPSLIIIEQRLLNAMIIIISKKRQSKLKDNLKTADDPTHYNLDRRVDLRITATWLRTFDPVTEVVNESLPVIEEEEDNHGRNGESHHNKEIEDFCDFLYPQPSFQTDWTLLTATGETAAHARCD